MITGILSIIEEAEYIPHKEENCPCKDCNPRGHVNIPSFGSMILASINSFHEFIKLNRKAIANAGVVKGSIIFIKVYILDAPSIMAASSSVVGIES